MTTTDTADTRHVASIRTLGAPGDLGWVVMAHGELYADQFGWDTSFEALVAGIVADFAEEHDPRREAAWVAELEGRRVGCIFCVADTPDVAGTSDTSDDDGERTAKLRILLVDPAARGQGLGRRLVDTCVSFARGAGYTRLTLWTNDVLASARRIYQAAGFVLVDEHRHHSFGQELVGQHWSLDLVGGP